MAIGISCNVIKLSVGASALTVNSCIALDNLIISGICVDDVIHGSSIINACTMLGDGLKVTRIADAACGISSSGLSAICINMSAIRVTSCIALHSMRIN